MVGRGQPTGHRQPVQRREAGWFQPVTGSERERDHIALSSAGQDRCEADDLLLQLLLVVGDRNQADSRSLHAASGCVRRRLADEGRVDHAVVG
jgi:hypothetical protein